MIFREKRGAVVGDIPNDQVMEDGEQPPPPQGSAGVKDERLSELGQLVMASEVRLVLAIYIVSVDGICISN